MASVFDPFRKKQKQMLAVVAVLCMVGFIFGSTNCDPGASAGQQGGDVVQIYDETLDARQLESLLVERQMAAQFVSYLRGGGVPDFVPITPEFSAVAEAMAMDAKAMGVVISDAAINRYIDDNNFTQQSQREINKVLADNHWSADVLFRALRRELLAQQAMMMFVPAPDTAVVSPARLWEYYQRLHRRAKTSALAVDAKDFVDQVLEPSEADLKILFDEYKSYVANPYSPEPGFSQPLRATIEFVMADYQKFYDQAESELTEEDLKKYYEDQKATQFKFTELIIKEDPIVAPPASNDPVPGQEKPADGDENAASNADGNAQNQDADQSSGDGNTGDAGAGGSGSADGGDGNFLPVSFLSEDVAQDDTSQDGSAQGNTTQGDAAQGDANQADTTQSDGAQDDAAAAQDADAARLAQFGQDEEQDIRSIQQIADSFRIPNDILGGPNPEFDPFWKVRDDILAKLANDRATERINAAIAATRAPLDAYQAELTAYRTRRAGGGDETDPNNAPRRQEIQQQVEGLAQEHGLTFATDKAVEVDGFAFQEIEELQDVSSMSGDSFNPLGQLLFSPTNYIYSPVEGSDADNNKYLAWKTRQVDAFEPTELSEVRQQVVDAWKLREAAKLAKAKAEEIAAACNKDKTLADFATGENKVIHPEPFTWYRQNYDPAMITPEMAARLGINIPPYSLTSLEDLDKVGNEFFKETFSLAEGTAGIAENVPRNVYYVVNIDRYDYQTGLGGTTEEDARRDFLLTNPNRLANLYAMDYQELQARFFSAYQDPQQGAVKWLPSPQ